MKTLLRHSLAVSLTLSLPLLAMAGKVTKESAGGKPGKATASTARGAGPAAGAPAAAAAPAKAASYEELRAAASPAGDLANLVAPLFSNCSSKNDLTRRQCELIRSWHLERLKTRTWYAEADAMAFQPQPYDSTTKTTTVTINGCLSCAHPPVIDGVPRMIVTGVPKGMDEGAPIGIDVATKEVTFNDAERAKTWGTVVRQQLRTEFVFTVGQPFDSKMGKGVSITLLGHRVYDSCWGHVVSASPASKEEKLKIASPAASCKTEVEVYNANYVREQRALPETLSRKEVQEAMAPVQVGVYECGEVFELKQGVARVHVTLKGNGESKMTISEPYDKGDIYLCLKEKLKDAKFKRFRDASPPVEVDFPFVLRR